MKKASNMAEESEVKIEGKKVEVFTDSSAWKTNRE